MKIYNLFCGAIVLSALLARAEPPPAAGVATRFKGDVFTVEDVQGFKNAADKFATFYTTNSMAGSQGKAETDLDRAYLVNYVASYQLAEQLKQKQLNPIVILITTDNSYDFSKSSFLQDPVYKTNQLKLIRNLVRVLGGQPDVVHSDCVAVGSKYGFGGSGTLIAPRLVVTAGHCYAYGLTNRVLVGVGFNDSQSRIYHVKKAVPYPQYNPATLQNDLCLLVLNDAVTNVVPRTVATTDQIANSAGAYISGFGDTNANATAGAGLRRCAGPIGFGDANIPTHGAFANIELVLGPNYLSQDTCNGDSGGPLYVEIAGQEYLAGVTSRAAMDSTRACGDGGIYVRLDAFTTWIKAVAQANGLDFNQ